MAETSCSRCAAAAGAQLTRAQRSSYSQTGAAPLQHLQMAARHRTSWQRSQALGLEPNAGHIKLPLARSRAITCPKRILSARHKEEEEEEEELLFFLFLFSDINAPPMAKYSTCVLCDLQHVHRLP
eukprot:601893-Prymnesium_polylepis.1